MRVVPPSELTAAQLYAVLRLRVDVFVVEQECPYPDLDGRDLEPGTRHLWIGPDYACRAYLRMLRENDGSVRIGRVCVARMERGLGRGRELMNAALAEAGPNAVCVLDAQAHLASWYAGFGFEQAGPEFVEDGIPHVPMRRESGPAGYAASR